MAGDVCRGGEEKDWELRPGGMLVQKRTDAGEPRVPPSKIRVRVKFGAVYHDTLVNSQATFGELKKILSEPTGLHHQDQKLFYRNKERDSSAFLDAAGVKDKSKLLLMEDPISKEKRYIELKKNAHMEMASKIITHVTLKVDKLARQVSALETVISKGGKVVENDLVKLTDSLMNELLKLEGVPSSCLQRKLQVERVHKFIETLDVLKLKNSEKQMKKDTEPGDQLAKQQPLMRSGSEAPVVMMSTKWETFDSAPAPLIDVPSSSSTAPPLQAWDLL